MLGKNETGSAEVFDNISKQKESTDQLPVGSQDPLSCVWPPEGDVAQDRGPCFCHDQNVPLSLSCSEPIEVPSLNSLRSEISETNRGQKAPKIMSAVLDFYLNKGLVQPILTHSSYCQDLGSRATFLLAQGTSSRKKPAAFPLLNYDHGAHPSTGDAFCAE